NGCLDVSALFSDDYFVLRERFRHHAESRGANLISFPIHAEGPSKEELTIDVAWLGNPKPTRGLLHICGTHGVEGYAGSAIQAKILSEPLVIPSRRAVVFIHGLNPWGMAHLRRFNESNVDLGRNFLLDESDFEGVSDIYRSIQSVLTPPGLPRRI